MVKNLLAIFLLVSFIPNGNAQEDSLKNQPKKIKPEIELGLTQLANISPKKNYFHRF